MSDVGFQTALSEVCKLIAQPLWGYLADHTQNYKVFFFFFVLVCFVQTVVFLQYKYKGNDNSIIDPYSVDY